MIESYVVLPTSANAYRTVKTLRPASPSSQVHPCLLVVQSGVPDSCELRVERNTTVVGLAAMLVPHKLLNLGVMIRPLGRSRYLARLVVARVLLGWYLSSSTEDLGCDGDVFRDWADF